MDLTVDQWVVQWRERTSRAEKLTADEWATIKEAIKDSYLLAGLKPPAAVIPTRSPREAMQMALAHLADQPMAQANAATRIAAAIRGHELELLHRRHFTGAVAARVDSAGLSPGVWSYPDDAAGARQFPDRDDVDRYSPALSASPFGAISR